MNGRDDDDAREGGDIIIERNKEQNVDDARGLLSYSHQSWYTIHMWNLLYKPKV